jgi:hypothetical protein
MLGRATRIDAPTGKLMFRVYWRSLETSPVGYSCINCRTSSRGHHDHILKAGQALVRRDFEKHWKIWQSNIDELTNNRHNDFTAR